ncbi:MAG TPA: polyphosphate kinase 1 [Gemmatimonadales bacterium]|nr:polyphosphate kinase 1 [Gemmatimonadales bacterium]
MSERVVPAFPRDHYINRELSWLEFNARVLEEAADPTNPWLERLKFLSIFSSNLDEFFEIRVAGLQQQAYAGVEPQDFGADGIAPSEQLAAIDRRVHALVAEEYRVLQSDVFPGLAAEGIERVRYDGLSQTERRDVDRLFHSSIFPVLTPLAIDPGHPFPHVHNRSLNIALLIDRRNRSVPRRHLAVVQVPSVLDRVVVVTRAPGRVRYILLEDIIANHLGELFGGLRVVRHTVFRLTRNTDLTIEEEDAEDLLETIEESLRQRMRSDPVRLEVSADADEAFIETLTEAHDLGAGDLYRVDGPVDLTALLALHRLEGFDGLRDEPLVPRIPPAFAQDRNMFEIIRGQDVLVHLPYESFGCVTDFIQRAADDPDVLAIKQTLYRTSGASPVVSALARAALNGKQVTALVELKARADERNNIAWARQLEESGVHVVYGVVGLKTHCKASLVVRREAEGLRRYVHLSTGNYNPTTARVYTDLGLFTSDQDFGEDTSALFNLLTGYAEGYEWKRLVVAPLGMRERIIALIEREERNAKAGRSSRIIVKMNALVEPSVIEALYRASQAGVPVDLVIRGICCLRPGLPGVSENIRVTSIVDKFLEHSRIFYFENGGDSEIFLGSADWMPRNFWRRIETVFPIENARLKGRIVNVLEILLADNVKARELRSDGTYVRRAPREGEPVTRCQVALQHLAREAREQPGNRPLFQPVIRRAPVLSTEDGATPAEESRAPAPAPAPAPERVGTGD